MANNISIKDASGATKVLHTIEDSTSAHYNQSIPINTSGALLFDTVPGNVSITNTLPMPVSVVGGIVVANVSLGAGSANIGTVSISPTQANIPVSLALPTFNVPVSIAGGSLIVNASLGSSQANIGTVSISPTQANIPVSVAGTVNAAQSGTWNVNASVVGRVSVFVDQVPFNVSVNNTLPIPVSVVGGRVSIQGTVSISPQTINVNVCNALTVTGGTQLVSVAGAVSTQAVQVGFTDGTNLRTPLTDTTGRVVISSIADDVSIAPQTLLVHVCNSLPAAGATPTVSIGGAVSLQAVQIAGRDINGDARTPRLHTDGSVIVHVCNAQAAPSSDVSVSPTQGSIPVSVAGTVNVANVAGTALIGAVSIRQIVSVVPDGTGANFPVSIAGVPAVTINAGTALLGAVSIRQIVSVVPDGTGANFPVSIAGTPTVNAAQSGTFTVQPGNTANTTPWLVSVGGNVSLTDNAPVSVRGGILGAVSIGGGTAHIGRVSVFVDQVPFNVSINNSLPVPVSIVGGALTATINDNAPVSVRGGRVSIADSTLAVTQSGTWGVGVNAGTNLIGAVSIRQIVSVVPDGTGANFPVSIAGTPTVNAAQSGTFTVQPGNTANTTPWLVSIGGNVSLTDNAPVSVRGGVLGAVSLGGGTAQVGRVSVFVDQVPFNVSINNSLPIPVSVVGGRVSIQGISQVSVAGAVTVSPLTNTGAAVPAGAFMVGGTDGTNLRALLVDALGALKVTGFVTNSEASFTRATDTVTYAAGDLVANTTVAGTVTPMTFAVSRFATGGGSIMVRRAKVVKSDGDLTNAQFRVHLYNTSNGVTNQGVSVAGGDNTGYVATQVSNYLGFLSVTCQTSHSNGAVGWGGPHEGMEMNAVLGATQFGIQGLLEVRAGYVPSSGERFNVTLEVYQD